MITDTEEYKGRKFECDVCGYVVSSNAMSDFDVDDFDYCPRCGVALIEEDDEYPCNDCSQQDYCDGWEAQFCCKLCHYYSDEPDCENCDPMDI